MAFFQSASERRRSSSGAPPPAPPANANPFAPVPPVPPAAPNPFAPPAAAPANPFAAALPTSARSAWPAVSAAGTLSLRGRALDAASLSAAAAATAGRTVASLDASGCELHGTDAAALPLLRQLIHKLAVREASLASNALGAARLGACVLEGGPLPALAALDVSRCRLNPAAGAALGAALRDGVLPALRRLVADGNALGDAGVAAVFAPGLDLLSVRSNTVSDRGPAALLAAAGTAGAGPRDVRLGGNDIGAAGAAVLGAAAAPPARMFASLELATGAAIDVDALRRRLFDDPAAAVLGPCPALGTAGAVFVAALLQRWAAAAGGAPPRPPLRVDLDNAAVSGVDTASGRGNRSAAGPAALAAALSALPTLTAVSLSSNALDGAAAAALLAHSGVFSSCPNLASLSVSNNRLPPDAVAALLAALRRHNAVTALDLSSNTVGAAGAAELARWLADPLCVLADANVGGGGMGQSGAEALSVALTGNRSLTRLHVGGNSIGAGGKRALGKALLFAEHSRLASLACDEWALPVGATELDVSARALSDADVVLLAGAVATNGALRSVVLGTAKAGADARRRNTFGVEGAEALARAVLCSSSLEVVLAEHCGKLPSPLGVGGVVAVRRGGRPSVATSSVAAALSRRSFHPTYPPSLRPQASPTQPWRRSTRPPPRSPA